MKMIRSIVYGSIFIMFAFNTLTSFGSGVSGLTTVALQDYGGKSQRWRDIGENVYAGAYQTAYTYSQASAVVTYEQCGLSFVGSFNAVGLKPNFAYQLKLMGKPEEDAVSDQHLRDIGRTYDIALGLSVGYVVFDYVVTDRNGEVHKQFSLANSYHVLWKVSQRAPGAKDSSPTSHVVEGSPGDAPHAYDDGVGPTWVEIYAEWEKGEPGNVQLPVGTYDVEFIITEESFHSAETDPTGGYWSTVMGCDVNFTCGPGLVVPVAPFGVVFSLLGMLVASAGFLGLKRARRRDLREKIQRVAHRLSFIE
jgi:hypothetical protein